MIRIQNNEGNLLHEIIINNLFLKHLNINIKPKIFNAKRNPSFGIKIKSKYFVIFPGSSNSFKNWKAENYINITKLICQKYKLTPLICGDSSEIPLSKKIISSSPKLNWYSLVGETSIGQLVEVIRESSFLISNDTSAVHISESVGTKCFCILGGGHFGRFAPYSGNSLDSCSVSIYKNLSCFNCMWKCTLIKPEHSTYPCIDNISVDDVMGKIEFFFRSNKNLAEATRTI